MIYELEGFTSRSKARPQAGKGFIFMPKAYQDWKQSVRDYLATNYNPTAILGPCTIAIEIHAPGRRGDIDNIAGAIFDAIQPPRAKGNVKAQRAHALLVSLEDRCACAPGVLIGDDSQIVDLHIKWVVCKTKHRKITIELKEVA